MKQIYLFTIITLIFTACSALKVDVDYDRDYDFDKKTTYAIAHNDKEGDNTLVNDRIKDAIRANLKIRNYEEVDKAAADLIIVFHVNVMNMSDIRTDYQRIGYSGYGYSGGWGYGGYGYGSGTVVVARPTTYRWQEGKLVINALDPKTKKTVWRGTVTDELSRDSSSVEEKTVYINKVIAKLMKGIPTKVLEKN